ncbi:MAG: hypothetical protein V7782_12125 [Psychromonas sp.]
MLAHVNAVLVTQDIIEQANAKLVGDGILFEKSFQAGAALFAEKNIDTLSLARISSLENSIHF